MNLVKSLWVSGLLSILGVIYFGYENYVFNLIWDKDFTRISFMIMALFSAGYLTLGYKIFKNKIRVEDDLDIGYEIGDTATSLGLLGTLIGISVVMSSFHGVNFESPAEIQKMIGHIGGGLSLALYTTLAGVVSQIILRLSYYFTGEALIKKPEVSDEE